ncbi:unnamed protein product [Heligmosomoides polygyrus]|uniref:G_PROTEIN_RECEP_F1_2 domain-containing protein n=1 Tax=Heligmosomoides polygyrus TaxID=6339 RepID=A0A183GTP7_HELPZ|nr:unnamed protein product [Heligmosomoides polygyrus]
MYESVAVACQIISSVSLLANIYLAYLYFCCPANNLTSYKHFFLGTALQNLLFSTCFILVVPVIMSRDFAFAFVAYGPLREQNKGQALMALLCLVFFSSIALTADTFIYRYLYICK